MCRAIVENNMIVPEKLKNRTTLPSSHHCLCLVSPVVLCIKSLVSNLTPLGRSEKFKGYNLENGLWRHAVMGNLLGLFVPLPMLPY